MNEESYEESKIRYLGLATAHLANLPKPKTVTEAIDYCRKAVTVDVPSDTVAWNIISDKIYDAVLWVAVDFSLDSGVYRIP